MNWFYEMMKDRGTLTNPELENIFQAEQSARTDKKMFRAGMGTILNNIGVTAVQHAFVLSDQKRFMKPPLNNEFFMRRGLHLFRVIFSHYAAQHRGCEEWYLNDGYMLHHDFLLDPCRSLVAEQLSGFPPLVHKDNQNTIKNLNASNYKATREAAFGEMKDLVLKAIQRKGDPNAMRLYDNNTFAQNVLNDPDNGDIQKNIHTDTFFPAIKWWYFPEEVKEGDGPFMYAPGSAALSFPTLDYLYDESIKICSDRIDAWMDIGHIEGSLRISLDKLEKMRYNLTMMAVPADTLMIGNVQGWHRRGDAKYKHTRGAIHGSIRVPDPFGVE